MIEHSCDCCGHVHGDLEAYEKVAQLEAKLLAHRENEGDACPLCQCEADLAAEKQASAFAITCMEKDQAENERLRGILDAIEYDWRKDEPDALKEGK